ncbi:hypothetical protein GCM10012275_01350 [Longimycelium tulufanense]|uniref:Uncharacterized protein n=1 Tax=Longimycelium tulufanense TaxID=907463 RepID=A0A8J3C790_9PSEU|nr:hypothetical protein [Longimycelium tulufanense]GGM33670.1 hypothetical protein GCM10012275_01350 [Longimycelium tulufanense]
MESSTRHRSRVVLLLLSFLVAVAASLVGTQVASATPGQDWVWRVDTRHPYEDQIFTSGFSPRGNNNDLTQHVSGASIRDRNSGFVATTANRAAAERIAYLLLRSRENGSQPNSVWIYQIRPSEQFRDVNLSLDYSIQRMEGWANDDNGQLNQLRNLRTVFGWQQEFASLGSIPASQVHSAQQLTMRWGEVTEGNPEQNRRYQAGRPVWNNEPYQARSRDREPIWAVAGAVIGLGWCLGKQNRQPRSVEARATADSCGKVEQVQFKGRGKVWDPRLNREVTRDTLFGWTEKCGGAGGKHCVRVPDVCSVRVVRSPSGNFYDMLTGSCGKGHLFDKYRVKLGAGGSSNTYVDQTINGFDTSHEHSILANKVWDKYHGKPLSENYRLADVFQDGSSWWSNFTIVPEMR